MTGQMTKNQEEKINNKNSPWGDPDIAVTKKGL